jgi:hypothetical protein
MAAPLASPPVVAPPPRPSPLRLPLRTRIKVILSRELATDQDRIGDSWSGVLAQEVVAQGRLAWAKGVPVRGVIVQSAPASRLERDGGLELRICSVAGAELEAGSFAVPGTDEPVVRIPGGAVLVFSLSAPKDLRPEP